MLDERKITAGLERLAARVEPDPQLWDRIKEEINRDHSPRSRRHVCVFRSNRPVIPVQADHRF